MIECSLLAIGMKTWHNLESKVNLCIVKIGALYCVHVHLDLQMLDCHISFEKINANFVNDPFLECSMCSTFLLHSLFRRNIHVATIEEQVYKMQLDTCLTKCFLKVTL